MKRIVIEVPAVSAKPRMVRSDRWKQRPAVLKYRAFADSLRAAAGDRLIGVQPDHVDITVTIAMPKSWSKKKRAEMDGKPHQARLDIDNIEKACLDSLWPEQDGHIWSLAGTKRWGTENRTVITVTEF